MNVVEAKLLSSVGYEEAERTGENLEGMRESSPYPNSYASRKGAGVDS